MASVPTKRLYELRVYTALQATKTAPSPPPRKKLKSHNAAYAASQNNRCLFSQSINHINTLQNTEILNLE